MFLNTPLGVSEELPTVVVTKQEGGDLGRGRLFHTERANH